MRNNGGGAWNHNLWWRILAPYKSPATKTSALSDDLRGAIEEEWGSVEEMVAEVGDCAIVRARA